MPAGTGLGQSGGSGGMTPAELARLEYLETNEYKITYWASIATNSGTITKPTGSTIILDSFASGVDALVETISNGQPTGYSPVTGGGAYVTVSSFDASGNYTLSGTPSATPVALLYVITIPADQYQNLDLTKIIMPEYNNPVVQTITNGDTSHAPSSDAVYDALATKQNTLTNPVTGTGTSNEIAYWSASNTIGSLAVATYPNLTELSYVKGLTSAIQTQLDNKVSYTMGAVTSNSASPADSITYYTYLGGGISLLTAAQAGIQFAKTGTINIFQITGFHSTNASNESVSFYLRNVTTATDYTITTSWDDSYGANASITRTYTGLNIPISNTTDKWILKIVTPSWGTNPTNWAFIFSYIIEF